MDGLYLGHGNMNGFLYKRGLAEIESCVCGARCEDWRHVLVECPLYEDMRNLSDWGVIIREDRSVDVSHVLDSKDKYECLSKYAVCIFERRRVRMSE